MSNQKFSREEMVNYLLEWYSNDEYQRAVETEALAITPDSEVEEQFWKLYTEHEGMLPPPREKPNFGDISF